MEGRRGSPTVTRPRVRCDVMIYHNPQCGTSRKPASDHPPKRREPHIIEYLKYLPTRARLIELIAAMGISGGVSV